MRSINNRLEILESELIKDEDGIFITKEWLLCITGGISMPMPIMSYLNTPLEQRLENLNRVEARIKDRADYERERLQLKEAKNRLLEKIRRAENGITETNRKP